MTKKEYLRYKDSPLSNLHLDEALKESNKQKFDDALLKPNTDIEKVFENRGHSIIFHRWEGQQIGHWYCVLRDENKNIFFLDSLGKPPEYYSKNWIPFFKHNGIKNVIVNKKAFQAYDSSVCGRYGILFSSVRKLNKNISAQDIYKMMEAGKKKHSSYDNFVLYMTT